MDDCAGRKSNEKWVIFKHVNTLSDHPFITFEILTTQEEEAIKMRLISKLTGTLTNWARPT